MSVDDSSKKYVQITEDELDISEASSFVSDPKLGAISIFVGTTRNFETKGDEVVTIDR